MSTPFRLFAIFAVGIILPGVFLSYLGFRSFQYEGMLLKKQTEERYSAVADSIQRRVQDYLLAFRATLRTLVSSEAFQRWDLPTMTKELLATERVGDASLLGLFVFDHQERMVFPLTLGPPVVEGEGGRELDWGPFREEIQRLERLEFVEKNVTEAVKGYEALRQKSLVPTLQAALLKNIASGYRKLNNERDAEANYRELIRRFDHVRDPTGYPMGVLGRQLLAKLYETTGQLERVLSMRLELAEGLLFQRWLLSAQQRTLLEEELHRSVPQQLSAQGEGGIEGRTRWAQLQRLRRRLESLRPQAQTFVQNVWPKALAHLRARGGLEQGAILRLTALGIRLEGVSPQQVQMEPVSTGGGLLIVAPILDQSSSQRHGLAAAVVVETPIWRDLQRVLVDVSEPAGVRVAWDYSDQTGSAFQALKAIAWPPSLQRSIAVIDPPLTLRVMGPPSQVQERFLRRRMWIYGGIFGLSLLVIIAGLVVMGQAITREMEIARLKADFVANVSHELRTPLAAISYIGERLSLGRYRSPDEVKEFYSILGEETVRLRELIEDILDFSKMLEGRKVYTKEPMDLGLVVREANERFTGKANAGGFAIVLDIPQPQVIAAIDRRTVLQAILNLLDNALKYSGKSRIIHLRLTQQDRSAIVSVQDFGIGIPPDELDKIFEKFYRVEHALVRDSEGGVGLGLAMVKHIMEGHGGQVTVTSHPGQGSTFSLWFPLSGD